MRLPNNRERSASETELRLLIAQAPTAIAMLDRDMHYLAASRRYLSAFCLGDIVGRSHYEVFPQLPEHWKQVHRRLLAGGPPHCEEDSYVHADGSVQWMLWTSQAWHTDSGEIGGLLGFGEDITERKASEARERAHLERLDAQLSEIETLYRSAPIGLGMLDRDLRCVRINEKMAEINGVPVEATLGRTVREILPAELADMEEPKLRKVFNTGEAVLGAEVQGQTAAGIPSIWLVGYHPVRNGQGAIVGVQLAVQDVSSHARAKEQEVAELRANLARAERVSALGHLGSALAHEMSQPIGAIRRNAEAADLCLRHANPDLEELRSIVTDILKDDERAGELINRMRSLIKRGNLDMRALALGELLQDVFALLHTEALSRRVALNCVMEPGLPHVWGDRVHVSQVLLNLILNAMDAMQSCPENARRIDIVARAVADRVEIAVSDSGPGIAAENLERVFSPLFSTKAEGLGMGLAISRTIIEAHGGRLWAENRADASGATFRFTLPAADQKVALTAAVTDSVAKQPT